MKTRIQCGVQSQPAWFASWFDCAHYHRVYAHRDEQEAGDFISRLIAWLQAASGSSILDLGCGSGRHSRYLASMGFDATGLEDVTVMRDVASISIQPASIAAIDHDRAEKQG